MFVNLSQHPLTILNCCQSTISFEVCGRQQLALDGDPEVILALPPWEGDLPEVVLLSGETIVIDGVTIASSGGEEVKNLPDPQEGVVYISSMRVAKATPHRKDVVAPGRLVFVAPHEGRGEIAGCLGLQK